MEHPKSKIQNPKSPVRVLIVEDTAVVRQFLEHIIGGDPRLEVVGSVATAEEALSIIHQVRPDVISLDIRLPGMNGFEATQRIMSERPTPIVVVSASVSDVELNITMNALRAGALSVVEKPVGLNHEDYQRAAVNICTQLAIMSEVRVIRQQFDPRNHLHRLGGRENEAPSRPPGRPGRLRMVGIVTSTGGPKAVTTLFGGLSAEFPLPILLVQHIDARFHGGYVEWLDSCCPFSARTARDEELPRPGTVYVAPPERHLEVERGRLRVVGGAPVCSQMPSGTVLFESMAKDLGPEALGVLLTGMGKDGAEGLKKMREAGAYTLAEDASTAIVYGMPGEAAAIGAVCESLPIQDLAARISELAMGAPAASAS